MSIEKLVLKVRVDMLMSKLINNIVYIIDIIVSRQVTKSFEKMKQMAFVFSHDQRLVSGNMFENYTLSAFLKMLLQCCDVLLWPRK